MGQPLRLALASALVLLGACTTSTEHATTTPTTPAPPATATASDPIQVRIVAGALAGYMVMFHDADGNMIGMTTTDATGLATSPAGIAPASVTALLGGDDVGYHKLVTWTAVAPGDVLKVPNVGAETMPTANPDIGYAVTSPGSMPNATAYMVGRSDCAQQNPVTDSTAKVFYQSCTGETAVLIEATDEHYVPIAFAFQKGLTPPTASDMPLTLTNWLPAAHLAIATPNVQDPRSMTLEVDLDVGGRLYHSDMQDEADGFSVAVAPGFADRYFATLELGISPMQTIKQVIPAGTTAVTIDAATALPALASVKADYSTDGRPALHWTSAAPLTEADGGDVMFVWGSSSAVPNPNGGGEVFVSGSDSGSWDIYIGNGLTSVQAPQLPPEAKAWLPRASASGRVTFQDYDDVQDSRGYRQTAATRDFLALPTSGTLRTVEMLAY